MGNWPALIPSIDPTCHFTVSPRLGFTTATALGCSTQPTTSLSFRGSNNSPPHSSSFVLSSHTKPRTCYARAATDLARCRASRIRNPPELHAASRTSVRSRSFQGGSRVEYCVPRWCHQTGLPLPFCTTLILLDHMTNSWISHFATT
jgi:hypothetical protein